MSESSPTTKTELRKCSISNCTKVVDLKGLCQKHYTRQYRYGTTDKPLTKRGQLIASGQSRCPMCKTVKPLTDFNKDKNAPHGVAIYCRDCNKSASRRKYAANPAPFKNSHLKTNFGITLDQYNEMLEEQGGVCAICYTPPINRRLAVDHCHKTGRIRGLLCGSCNHALGFMLDSPCLLQNAINYLNKGESK